MSITTCRPLRNIRVIFVALFSAILLAACGGGSSSGGGHSQSNQQAAVNGHIAGRVADNVKTIPKKTIQSKSTTISAIPAKEGNGLVVTSTATDFAKLKKGDVVLLPPKQNSGPQIAFAGKVKEVTSFSGQTKLVLTPAYPADVYKSLSWDIDTAGKNTKVVGVIAPPGGTASFTTSTKQSRQVGVACTHVGVEKVAGHVSGKLNASTGCDGASGVGINGILKFEYPLPLPQSQQIDLIADVNLQNIRVISHGKMNFKKYFDTDGWARLSAKISGQMSGTVKLSTKGEKIKIDGFASRLDSVEAFDNLGYKSKYVAAQGLHGDDKQGLIPLGGVVLTVSSPEPVLAKPGRFPPTLLKMASAGAVVVWVYMDLEGHITLKGDTGFQLLAAFKQGYGIKAITDLSPVPHQKLEVSKVHEIAKKQEYLFAKGQATAEQTLGLVASADILVAGIRPASVGVFLGGIVNGEIGGNFKYYIVDSEGKQGPYGGGCYDSHLWGGLKLNAAFRVKATVDLPVFSPHTGEIDKSATKSFPFIDKRLAADCFSTAKIAFSTSVDGFTQPDKQSAKVTIDFRHSATDDALKNVVDSWQLVAGQQGASNKTFTYNIPSAAPNYQKTAKGIIQIKLPLGHDYKLTLKALHDSFTEPAQTVSHDLTLKLAPTASFTAQINGYDCTSLYLEATATATGSRTIDSYQWRLSQGGQAVGTYTGKQVNAVTLPSCGNTMVQLTVTDSDGLQTIKTRTINTNAMAPQVTSLVPLSAELEQKTVFTLTGKNLPLTTVLSIRDASCGTPFDSSHTGFKIACTPHASGSKKVTVKTDTNANGGIVINNAIQVTISQPTVVGITSLNDTGITTCGDYAYGHGQNHDNNLDCAAVGASKTQQGVDNDGDPVPAGQDALYGRDALAAQGKLQKIGGGPAGFDYTKLDANGDPLPASATSWPCVRDNVTGLVWETKSTNAGLHAMSNSYTWYNDDSNTNGGAAGTADGGSCSGSRCDTQSFVEAVKQEMLCGFSDWRMPSSEELLSLVNKGKYNPAANENWLGPVSGLYWSASPDANYNYLAWFVSFGYGYELLL